MLSLGVSFGLLLLLFWSCDLLSRGVIRESKALLPPPPDPSVVGVFVCFTIRIKASSLISTEAFWNRKKKEYKARKKILQFDKLHRFLP